MRARNPRFKIHHEYHFISVFFISFVFRRVLELSRLGSTSGCGKQRNRSTILFYSAHPILLEFSSYYTVLLFYRPPSILPSSSCFNVLFSFSFLILKEKNPSVRPLVCLAVRSSDPHFQNLRQIPKDTPLS